MNWNFLITFAIGIGVYLVVMIIAGIVKHHINKKRLMKDEKNQNED